MRKPSQRWWWIYAAAMLAVSVIVFGAIGVSLHDFDVAVGSASIFGSLVWLWAMVKIAGAWDGEISRRRAKAAQEQEARNPQ